MKIHNRLLVFVLVSIAFYAIALHALRRGVERISDALLDVEVQELTTHLNRIVDLEYAPLEKGIFDKTFWDDMVAFVRTPDREWAKENIDDAFPNYGVQFVWVYAPDQSLVYAMSTTRADPTGAQLSVEHLRDTFDGQWFRHFYGRNADDALVEYFTAPIQPSADSERHTPPQGFLVGARLLDHAFVDRLASLTGSPVGLDAAAAGDRPSSRADPHSGLVEIFQPLVSWNGAPLATLHTMHRNATVQVQRTALDRYNRIYLAFAAVNLALLTVFIFAWVKIPLQRISDSLDRQEVAPVARYFDARHEFGTLARLIRSFFQQREALVTEIEMRKQYESHLREARDLADRSARAKADFLSVMSHELRTPLNAVIGLASLVLQQAPRPDQVENLTTLRFSAETLLALINDVLDFNKMDAGKLQLERRQVDLGALVDSLRRSFEPQARAKGLTLTAEIGADVPPVLGDPLRLAQILGNLLSNAVKFTERGIVRLTVGLAEAGEARVRIAFHVADTGVGIPIDQQAQIFELFTQVRSESERHHGGTGLGLTIVRKLLALMGSAIELDSAPGRGSTFRFTLELPRAPEPAAIAPERAAPSADRLADARVLLVEDNAVNRQLAATFLRKWGCAVDVADTGALAVDKAAAQAYDLILMDIQMPEMSGIEATARIRAQPDGPNLRTPILAFTATSPTADAAASDVGFDDYIIKPIDPERLRETLRHHLPRVPPA
jgi:signal transduction histidine kinase/ActR/RegA family two-component response regulator